MKREVATAVDFMTQLMRTGSRNAEQLTNFNDVLRRRISEHYRDHWFPEKPFKGSGYRCLRINHNMEPIILQAAAESGLSRDDLISMLPNELTMWIDPREVSYRIGEDGSVGVIYVEEEDNHKNNNAKKPSSPTPAPSSSSSSRPSSAASSSSSTSEVSWDSLFDPSLSPSRHHHNHLHQDHHPHPLQQCKDSYFHYQQANNINDTYDLKRLAAFVYS